MCETRQLRDGLRLVDILQIALDVAADPARGREQADYIQRHVLRWEVA